MTVLDNIRIANHHRIQYSLADVFLQLPRYRRQEAEFAARAMDLLRTFKLEALRAGAGGQPALRGPAPRGDRARAGLRPQAAAAG